MLPVEDRQRVYAYIDEHFQNFVDTIIAYARVPTIGALHQAGQEGADSTARLLEGYGIGTRAMETDGGPAIVIGEADADPSRPTIVLYNHYDVQPVDPLDEWQHDPFNPVVHEGMLYGRGVADIKGNTVAQALAAKAIREITGSLPVNLRFFVEGEEEIASPHLLSFAEAHPELFKADAATIEAGGVDFDGTPQISMGSKGILYVELRVRTADVDQHSSYAAILPNPAWRLIAALETLRNRRGKILIPGFYENVSTPSEEEISYLRKVSFKLQEFKKVYGVSDVLGGRTRLAKLVSLAYNPTCNIDGLYAGYIGEGVKTINPAYAKAKVDFRLVPGQRPADVLGKLKAHLAAKGFPDVEVVSLGTFEPGATPIGSHIGQTLIKACHEVYGRDPQVMPWLWGSSSTWYFTRVGTPAAIGPGVGYAGSKYHAPNEHIRLEDARRGTKAWAATIMLF